MAIDDSDDRLDAVGVGMEPADRAEETEASSAVAARLRLLVLLLLPLFRPLEEPGSAGVANLGAEGARDLSAAAAAEVDGVGCWLLSESLNISRVSYQMCSSVCYFQCVTFFDQISTILS